MGTQAMPGVFRGRFFTSGACLHLVLGNTSASLELRSTSLASIRGPVTWAVGQQTTWPSAGGSLVDVNAIYVPRATYGGARSSTVAVTGSYNGGKDSQVWSLDAPWPACDASDETI